MNFTGCLLLILLTGTLNIACLSIGVKLGQKVDKDEPIELPTINPIKAIREREDRRVAEKEQNRMDAILQNIDNYNGTSIGQKDVPR